MNLLPTHEENIMQQSARLSGSHELGGGQFSPVQVPVPSAIKSSIAYKELFMIPPFFGEKFPFNTICALRRARYRFII